MSLEGLTYCVIGSDILVKDRDGHIVSNVLNINIKDLLPFGKFASAVECPCSNFLLTGLYLRPRVHLTEELRVAGKFCFNYMQA